VAVGRTTATDLMQAAVEEEITITAILKSDSRYQNTV
jgi:hypothetical protein